MPKHYVFGLEISVINAGIVCCAYRITELTDEVCDPVRCSNTYLRLNLRAQSATFDELHRDVGSAVRHRARCYESHDSRVVNPGKRLYLLTKVTLNPFLFSFIWGL